MKLVTTIKYLEAANFKGYFRSPKKIYKIFKKIFPFFNSTENVKNFHDFLIFYDKIIPVLNAYHSENWDCQLNTRTLYEDLEETETSNTYLELHFFILFPKVEIKNSFQMSHNIKDLVVKFKFIIGCIQREPSGDYSFLDPRYSFNNRLQGTRLSVYDAEYLENYLHSHLPSLDTDYLFNGTSINWTSAFQKFCLGSSNVGDNLAMCYDKDSSNPELSTEKFEYFLNCLQTYVSYESLKGRPYKYIDRIGLFKKTSVSFSNGRAIGDTAGFFHELFEKFSEEEVESLFSTLEVEDINGIPKYLLTKEFTKTLKQFAGNLSKPKLESLLPYMGQYDENYNFQIIKIANNNKIQKASSQGGILSFRGQYKKVQLLRTNKKLYEDFLANFNYEFRKEILQFILDYLTLNTLDYVTSTDTNPTPDLPF